MFGLFRRNKDEVKVIGRATEYAPCRPCGARNTQLPRGHGETITRGGWYIVRQYHVCLNCNTKSLWHRRMDKFVWTLKRDGVA